ncbi:4Fe-4S dicluster domain-containing protein [Sporosarcina pasteurii]|uniref:Ferredoxin n=1 Tax=Sporosarcina pasteurii TaxID=1474 RepID=A0A380C4I9_SPOPA|nr:4Fe-4S dicluster domain-containing protein [Sporosarcina pasteurii]MDS9471621.1 4Fe-4S binding protein [Sporosarcina pasteurii]QBQ04769.1 4Fe-4S dicluster domain-containing protein [Sporosarcina pasteurii]SUJ11422.1 Seven-iron ferredoxin [Sporosarcina pasteurii]
MAYVITTACMTEKATDCVMVCPVDCIEEGENQYFINPDTCIECGACVESCPAEAIYHEDDLPAEEMQILEQAKLHFSIS